MKKNITTYNDLIEAQNELRKEVNAIEENISSKPIFKIATSFINGGQDIKDSIISSITSYNFKDSLSSPIGSVLTTLLLSNKTLRKYFVGFTILKETIPFAYSKLNEILKEAEEKSKSKADNPSNQI